MKYVMKVANGIAYIALAGALGIGLFFILGAIFSEGVSVWQRIVCGAVALAGFILGYRAEGGADTGEE